MPSQTALTTSKTLICGILTEAELGEQVADELIRGDVFEAQEMAEIERELEASRAFVPEAEIRLTRLALWHWFRRGET